MKHGKTLLHSFTAAFLALAFFCMLPPAAIADDAEVTFKFANYLPPQSIYSKTCEDFITDLETRSNGRIKVRYFPGGTLLKAPAMFKGIESGIADIGLSHILYTPGRMPVMEAGEMPVGSPTGWVASQLMNDFYYKFRPKEFDGVHPLWFHANSPAVLVTTKEIKSVDDLKGLSLRAPGRMGDLVAELGAAPTPTPIMETYSAISKGVIQGVLVGIDGLKSFRFAEVAKHTNTLNTVGLSYPFYVVMNKNAYAKIPADLKGMIDALCGEYSERFALMW